MIFKRKKQTMRDDHAYVYFKIHGNDKRTFFGYCHDNGITPHNCGVYLDEGGQSIVFAIEENSFDDHEEFFNTIIIER